MKLFFKLPVSVNGSKCTYNINGDEATHTFECKHEEVDTRIVLHVSLSSEDVVFVVTDMFIILNTHSI